MEVGRVLWYLFPWQSLWAGVAQCRNLIIFCNSDFMWNWFQKICEFLTKIMSKQYLNSILYSSKWFHVIIRAAQKIAKFHIVQRVLYFEKTALCNSSSLQYSICVLIVAVEIYYLIKIQEEKVTFQWELSVFPTWPKKCWTIFSFC